MLLIIFSFIRVWIVFLWNYRTTCWTCGREKIHSAKREKIHSAVKYENRLNLFIFSPLCSNSPTLQLNTYYYCMAYFYVVWKMMLYVQDLKTAFELTNPHSLYNLLFLYCCFSFRIFICLSCFVDVSFFYFLV